jgi:hypothetical protein
MKAEQFLLSFEEARKLLLTCREYKEYEAEAFVDVNKTKPTSEKEIRRSFLEKKSFSSIS